MYLCATKKDLVDADEKCRAVDVRAAESLAQGAEFLIYSQVIKVLIDQSFLQNFLPAKITIIKIHIIPLLAIESEKT